LVAVASLLTRVLASRCLFCPLQEDPYKLALLAKDVEHHCITSADFFFTDEGELSLVTGDEEGVIRTYQHNPQGKRSLSELTAHLGVAKHI
jgi:hypothetical protein